VDSTPTRTGSLNASSFSGLLAVIFSIAASLCLLLQLPVLYLAVDLLAGSGRSTADIDTAQYLGDKVSPQAAEQTTTGDSLGILNTVLRNRDHWSAGLLATISRWNKWAWTNEGLYTGLFLAAVVLFLLRGLFQNAAAHLASNAAIEAALKLRRDVYNHCYRLGGLATNRDQQVEAGEVITDRVERMLDGWVASRTTLIRTWVLVLFAAVILVLVNPWVGLAVLFLGGLVWLVAGQSAAWFRRDARHAERVANARMGVLRESLQLMLMVKCYLMERFSQTRVERQLNDLAKSARRQFRGEALSRPTLMMVAAITAAILLYLAGRSVLGGRMSVAAVAVQAACATAIALAVSRWASAFATARKGKGASADVAEFLDRRTDTGQAIDAEFLQPLTKKLDLIEVSYREPGTGRMVLEGVSMSVPAGTRAAVLCSDPDEARALAYLLTRFLEPTAGEVRIDTKNTRWVTFESLRTQVAMVLPDHTIFTDTVANNIGCGDTFTLPRIVDAAKAAHAHGFVQQMPYGYETLLGSSGYSLRPGERFRIALARALLRDPAILVVEEPSEPFDPDSTALIDDAVNRMAANRTVIILARRAATVKRADKVFIIQDGKMVAAGDHEALMTGSQMYKSLHLRRSQTEAGSM
jgi:ATP-binding cassette, subfamily B, bacterial